MECWQRETGENFLFRGRVIWDLSGGKQCKWIRKELKKTIAELILREETYADQMEQTVEPYLSKRRRRCSIEREKGKKIYCECYQADQGEGIALICHGFTEATPKYQTLCIIF